MKMANPNMTVYALAGLMTVLTSGYLASAQEAPSAEELAKKLANPVAALISVPVQGNYDGDIGPADKGEKWTLNIQPVVPISLNENWNLISRTIVPLVDQKDIISGAGSQSGIGDILQTLFVSPVAPTASGWIWGVGPALLFPTGSDDLLTGDKWAAGPSFVVLKQDGPWTYGALLNHIWSYAGEDDRNEISASFLQPFATYTTPNAVSITLQTETTYDWKSEQWSVPVFGVVSKVFNVGGQLVSLGAGVKYYADSTDAGAEGWGGRLTATLLFPK